MSAQSCRRLVQELRRSMEALAALGASLALSSGAHAAQPEISDRIHAVVELLDPDVLRDLSADDAAAIHAGIRTFFRQALDLLENPGRDGGWEYDDPEILQAQGQGSVINAGMIAEFAATHARWYDRLMAPGKFLDVGTGVGRIALRVAEQWPSLRVEGIDVLEPALRLAEANLATSDIGDRVTFRERNFADLDEHEEYCGAFVAGAFIPYRDALKGIEALYRATEPGCWIFYGLYRSQPDRLSEALTALRVTRSGGHAWTLDEITKLLGDAGFQNSTVIENESVAMLVAAQKT